MENSRNIFGYGSLVNEESLRRTVPNAGSIEPVNLNGYIRSFETPSKHRLTKNNESIAVLNIKEGTKKDFINGVCFEVTEEYFNDLLEREGAYNMKKVTVEPLENQKGRELISYLFIDDNEERKQEFRFGDEVQLDYLMICLKGAYNFGKDFYENFLRTTYIGEKTLKEMEDFVNKVRTQKG